MKRRLQSLLLATPLFEACCRLLTRGHVRALMYHRFSGRATDDSRFVDARTLARQLDLIRAHHTPMTPDQHLASHAGGAALPGPCPVVLTIDDGYRDVLEVAHPLLRERRLPAMLFMTTGLADGPFWFWWDKIEYLVHEAQAVVHELEVLGRAITLDLRTEAGRRQAWSDVADRCRFADNDEKLAAIGALSRDLGVGLPVDPPPHYGGVTWDELRGMVAEGLLVGAHTVTHPILSRVSQGDAESEIARSRARLEEQLAQPVPWFCYPQGGPADYTDELCRYLAEHGYRGSYLAYQITGHPGDPYRMPRYCVGPDEISFRWLMCGAEYLVRRLKSLFGLQPDISPQYWQS
ncbi:MAG: polysaccharide deacetylase family protein [Candidatus Krumholzibacteriia bacterium]